MLVLTRKAHEAIVVDGQVEITVLQVKGNRIRLGIQAPSSVSIRRGELPALPAAQLDGPGRAAASL
jgi:carbon storage regulator